MNKPYSPFSSNSQPTAEAFRRFWFTSLIVLLSFSLAACVRSKSQAPLSASLNPPDQIKFTNVAQEVGLNFQHGAFRWGMSADPAAMMGGGLCWLDYNNDGWLDLFVVNSYAEQEAGQWDASGGLPTSALFQNVAGKFSDISLSSGTALPLRGTGCVAADFNLDGWTDLYVTTARVNVLFWNNGNGTFTEGAGRAGVDAYGWQTASVVGDLNGDGWPDMFVAGYVDVNNQNPESGGGFPRNFLGLRDLLFINEGLDADGRVTFREVGEQVGLETSDFEYGLGALFTDLDSDGDLDLYVANDTNPNRLYVNVPWPGGIAVDSAGIGFRFEERGASASVDDTNSGMGIAGGDYDSDGQFDLVVTNMGNQLHSVYENQSITNLAFQDFSGLFDVEGEEWTGWGSSWGDFDLDTDLDMFIVTGNIPISDLTTDAQTQQMFGNLTAQGQLGQFTDWTDAAGLTDIGLLNGRGGTAADYDNDGDLDYAINQIGGPLTLLQNDAEGNWLEVQLDRFAPGTVVTVVLPNGQILEREVHAGSSYHSSEDPRAHFGLGSFEQITELRVRWLGGGEFVVKNVEANQLITVGFIPSETEGVQIERESPSIYLPLIRK